MTKKLMSPLSVKSTKKDLFWPFRSPEMKYEVVSELVESQNVKNKPRFVFYVFRKYDFLFFVS